MMQSFGLKSIGTLVFAVNMHVTGVVSAQGAGFGLWITDSGTRTIYEITVDGGPKSNSFFGSPRNARSGLAFDPSDDTFWAASEPKAATPRGSIVNLSRDGSFLSQIPAEAFGGYRVEGVAVDYFDSMLWVVDDPAGVFPGEEPTVYRIERDGTLIGSFPTSAFDANALSPQAIAADPFDGTLWVTDNSTDRIYHIDRDGKLIASFRARSYDVAAKNPQGITVDERNHTLWVTDRTSHRIYNISTAGDLISSFDSTEFNLNAKSPAAIAFDARAARTRLRTIIVGLLSFVDGFPSDASGSDLDDRVKVLRAIELIEKSLKPKYWLDRWTVHPIEGREIFERTKDAVQELLAVKDEYGANGDLFIEMDLNAPGDKLITFDTSTGLEWLDVTATHGLSYNQAITTPFVTAQGFRHANVSEVGALFTTFGIEDLSGIFVPSDFAGAQDILAKLECTGNCTGSFPFVGGWADLDPFSVDQSNNPFVHIRLSDSTARAFCLDVEQCEPTAKGIASDLYGNWLVRPTAEPTALRPSHAVAGLVEIDSELANAVYERARAAAAIVCAAGPSTKVCEKANKQITRSARALGTAQIKLAEGDKARAINRLKKAWKLAQKAIRTANRAN